MPLTLRTRLRKASQVKDLRLHVGCGLVAPPTWVNIDASWNALLAKLPLARQMLARVGVIPTETAQIPWPRNIIIHDVRKGLPIQDCAASAIYASHLIEHLTSLEAQRFLKECYRALATGGIIRIVTPDLEHLAQEYLDAKKKPGVLNGEAAAWFLNQLGLIPAFEGASALTRLYRLWKPTGLHKWLYDEASLRALLEDTGFRNVQRRGYLESQVSAIGDVEREERLTGAICLEANK